jgi:hypothetical protein
MFDLVGLKSYYDRSFFPVPLFPYIFVNFLLGCSDWGFAGVLEPAQADF